MKKYFIFLVCVFASMSSFAKRDSTMHKSETDALSYGIYVFANQSFNENLDGDIHHKFGLNKNSVASGAYLGLAKEWNPIFGWRGNLGYNYNKSRSTAENHDKKCYSFSDVEGFGDLTFDVIDFIFRDRHFTALDLKLFAGIGALQTFGYTRDSLSYITDYKRHAGLHFGFRGGINASWNITRNFRLAAEVIMNGMDDGFNGVSGNFPLDGRLNLGGGLIYTPHPNLKKKKKFINDPLEPQMMLSEHYKVNAIVKYVTPESEKIKMRKVSGNAQIAYHLAKADLDKNFMQNQKELEKIKSSIDEVESDKSLEVTSIHLHGYCSPEGSYDFNRKLSRMRALTVKEYLVDTYKFEDHLFKVAATPENWIGLAKAIEKSNIPNKEELKEIAMNQSYADDDRENQLMLAAGANATVLKNEIYPKLRYTLYIIKFNVKNYAVKEARKVIKENPDKLSLREMYDVAFSYSKKSDEFLSALQTAVKLNPNDPVANLNLANAYIERNNLEEAKRYLDASEGLPEAIHARGIVAALEGDYDAAEEYLKEAESLGVKESAQVLPF